MEVTVSLICMDMSDVKSDIDCILESSGGRFNRFHADVMDGHFVPRLGVPPELVASVKKRYGGMVSIDSHLMVSDPFSYCEAFGEWSDIVFFHREAVHDPTRVIQKIRRTAGLSVGMAYDVMTCPNAIELSMTDASMLMGISPGVLGTGKYFNETRGKIQANAFRRLFIDGAVDFGTIPEYRMLGVERVVCGSSTIFKIDNETGGMNRHEMIRHNVKRLMEAL